MAYREAAKPNTNFPRKRPAPALVLRRSLPLALFGIAVGLAGFALLFFPLALGTNLDCHRRSPSVTAECTLKSPLAEDIRFAGTPRALGLVIRDESNGETMLEADGIATRVLDDRAARAAQLDYETFVATPDVSSFHRRVRGPRFHGALFMAGALGVVASLLAGLFVERAKRVIVDVEADEIVIETVAFIRRMSEQTIRLSKIQRIYVQDAGDAFELVVTVDGVDRPLIRTDASGCQRAAMLIDATIAAA